MSSDNVSSDLPHEAPGGPADHVPRQEAAPGVMLSLDMVREQDLSGVCGAVLDVAAVLWPAEVRRDLLRSVIASGQRTGSADHAVDRLVGWSLATVSPDDQIVTVDRQIVQAVRDGLGERGRFAVVCRRVGSVLEARAQALVSSPDPQIARDFTQQVTALVEATAEQADDDLATLLLRLRFLTLYHLIELGDSGQAIAFGEPLVADLERLLGAGHPDTLTAENSLAAAYQADGQTGRAIPLFERTWAGRRRTKGPSHPHSLNSLNNLAVAYQDVGRTAEAIPLFESALTGRERVLGSSHPSTLDSRALLARAYQDVGRVAEAIPLLEQTLTGQEQVLGHDHPDAVTTRDDLASARRAAGQTPVRLLERQPRGSAQNTPLVLVQEPDAAADPLAPELAAAPGLELAAAPEPESGAAVEPELAASAEPGSLPAAAPEPVSVAALEPEPEPAPAAGPGPKSEPTATPEPESGPDAASKPVSEVTAEPDPATGPEPSPQPSTPEPESGPDATWGSVSVPGTASDAVSEAAVEPAPEPESKLEQAAEPEPESESAAAPEPELAAGPGAESGADAEPVFEPRRPAVAGPQGPVVSGRPARQGRGGSRRMRVPAVVAAVVVLLIAGTVTLSLSGAFGSHQRTSRGAASGPGAAGQGRQGLTAAEAMQLAAAWIGQQVSRNTIVACDPAACAALKARGVAAADLLTLRSTTANPLGAQLVVATPVLRNQFGSRLTSVYAPAVIAGFGSGAGLVEVRVVAPDGATSYMAELHRDQAARMSAGVELLANKRIQVSAQAQAQLEAGQVDSRLLLMLPIMAAMHPIHIVAFGDPGPGASPGVPMCSAVLAGSGKTAAMTDASYLSWMTGFLHAQTGPFAGRVVVRSGGGVSVVQVEFAKPSPLGLLVSE